MTKAIEYNIPVIFVSPKDTSTTCPKCRAKLVYKHRLEVCRKHEFLATRDIVDATNIYLRALRRRSPLQG